MALELKDYRGKITVEADCVLTAEARASGEDKSEIVRKILHVWAMKRLHAASFLGLELKSEGLGGVDEVLAMARKARVENRE